MYDLWTEPKRLVIADSGHVPPLELRSRVLNQWLDEIIGPAR